MCHKSPFVRSSGDSMLSGLLTVLLIAVALILILLIIALQHGNEGGIGSAFGSGNSAGFFGASGGVSLITRATWGFGFAFFVIAMSLAWVKTHNHFGVGREIDGLLGEDAPAKDAPSAVATSVPGAPAAAAPAAAAPASQQPANAPIAPIAPGSDSAPVPAAP